MTANKNKTEDRVYGDEYFMEAKPKWIEPELARKILLKHYIPPEKSDPTRFNIKDCLEPWRKAYIIVGNRSSGKTYSGKCLMLEDYLNNGDNFAYCRLEETDLTASKYDLWNDVCEYAFPDLTISIQPYIGNTFLCRFQDPTNPRKFWKFSLGKFASINNSDVLKGGNSFIKNILLDEFMSETVSSPNLGKHLNSMLISLFRDNPNGRFMMFANSLALYAPVFADMGIPMLVKTQDKWEDKDRGIYFERVFNKESIKRLKDSIAGKIFGSSEYMKMATDNVPENSARCIKEVYTDQQLEGFEKDCPPIYAILNDSYYGNILIYEVWGKAIEKKPVYGKTGGHPVYDCSNGKSWHKIGMEYQELDEDFILGWTETEDSEAEFKGFYCCLQSMLGDMSKPIENYLNDGLVIFGNDRKKYSPTYRSSSVIDWTIDYWRNIRLEYTKGRCYCKDMDTYNALGIMITG